MSEAPRRMVGLILGQSNVANHGPKPADAGPGVSVLADGVLRPARDPLPGASGDGGSVWTRLAPKLIAAGLFDEIVLVPAAAGGTAMADWAPGGACHDRIVAALAEVAAAGLEVSHVFWHQGERDTLLQTPGRHYRRDFLALVETLRGRGVSAPIILCIASYRFGATNAEVRAVQQAMADPAAGIVAGPDTDTLGPELRYDDCHFNARGQEAFAVLLFDSVKAA